MPYAFDDEKIAALLFTINGGPCDYDSWNLQKSLMPEWLDGLDPDVVVTEPCRLVLGGKADGLMDSCVFLLDPERGVISFETDYTQPREDLGVLQAPVWWTSKEPWPQPTKENMWVAKAVAIMGELLQCRVCF